MSERTKRNWTEITHINTHASTVLWLRVEKLAYWKTQLE